MVGSLLIESSGKPEKAAQALEPSVAIGECNEDQGHHRSTLDDGVHTLGHGALIRATFERHPHGQLTVTGVAVATTDDTILRSARGFWPAAPARASPCVSSPCSREQAHTISRFPRGSPPGTARRTRDEAILPTLAGCWHEVTNLRRKDRRPNCERE
jgi:hypothetical protein